MENENVAMILAKNPAYVEIMRLALKKCNWQNSESFEKPEMIFNVDVTN